MKVQTHRKTNALRRNFLCHRQKDSQHLPNKLTHIFAQMKFTLALLLTAWLSVAAELWEPGEWGSRETGASTVLGPVPTSC